MSLLQALNRIGALRTLDDALAQTLRRLDPDTPDAVLAAAALASLAVAQGHAAFDPARPRRLVDADLPWPEPEGWRQVLTASRFVAQPASPEAAAEAAPLVFEQGLLYLRRYREYERRLALGLRRIAAQTLPQGDPGVIAPLFAQLFPQASPALLDAADAPARDAQAGEKHGVPATDLQARAAALALRQALLLVTGGPGTGKTTTIARLLALRVARARGIGVALPRIALAAPTGRAADRMLASLRDEAERMAALGIDAGVLAGLPIEASTLHRLLGVRRDVQEFRHDAGNPLPHDIVVADEASMIDLPLMCKLVEAVADGTQLILLGDPDQLPSVEAGDVLAAIVRASGRDAAATDKDGSARGGDLHGHRVQLQRGWRQAETLVLAPLAEAVRAGDAARALSLLRGNALSNVHFHESAIDPLPQATMLMAHWRGLAAETDPGKALARIHQARLLTALREGPQGARGLNARIAAQLCGLRIGTPPAWFAGRLLLIVENSYRHGLFNGDVGICLPDADGTPLVWFPGGDGPRAFHPAALPAHESAFATTVHKAQGSEFDTVWLQLPDRDSRVLSRELLYTGITRARGALHVGGRGELVEAALSRAAGRISGLDWRLAPAAE